MHNTLSLNKLPWPPSLLWPILLLPQVASAQMSGIANYAVPHSSTSSAVHLEVTQVGSDESQRVIEGAMPEVDPESDLESFRVGDASDVDERFLLLPEFSLGRVNGHSPASPPYDQPAKEMLYALGFGLWFPFDFLQKYSFALGLDAQVEFSRTSKLKAGQPNTHSMLTPALRYFYTLKVPGVTRVTLIPSVGFYSGRLQYAARAIVFRGPSFGFYSDIVFDGLKLTETMMPIFAFGGSINDYGSRYKIEGSGVQISTGTDGRTYANPVEFKLKGKLAGYTFSVLAGCEIARAQDGSRVQWMLGYAERKFIFEKLFRMNKPGLVNEIDRSLEGRGFLVTLRKSI